MKQKNALESGFCTALRCRVFVRNGDGVQFVDGKKEIQRYCWRCWLRKVLDEIMPIRS